MSMLGRSRTKRAERYAKEETDSMLVDAESIQLFVDNTTKLSTQDVYKLGLNQKSSSADTNSIAKEFKPMVFESAKRKTNEFSEKSASSIRSPPKEKTLPEYKGDNLPKIRATLPSPTQSDVGEDDLFSTSFENINRRKNSARKIRNRLGENLSQSSPEGWDLCNEEHHAESKFKFQKNVPMRTGAKNYDELDLSNSDDKLVFLDIFEESKQNASGRMKVGDELESPAKTHQNLRRVRRHSDKNNAKRDLFTDFSFPDEESPAKSSLRELPWGKSTPELKPCGGILGIIPPGENTRGNSFPGSISDSSYTDKDTQEKNILEEKPREEDHSKLMEESEDLADVLKNSSGDQFTDTQGVKSFVCLVDQLTDLRVRHKFNSNYAGRRREAVCEELEKTMVWNEKSLYEYRRDLNIRKALNNMFM